MANKRGKSRSIDRFYFLGLQNHCGLWLQPQNLKTLAPWKKICDQPKKQRHHFACKGPSSQSYGFFISRVQMCWALKNWCFWIVALKKTLESLLVCKEIQPINPKGNQSWIFFGRTDVEAEAPILWSPDMKNWLLRKDLYAGKDSRQKEKGTTED